MKPSYGGCSSIGRVADCGSDGCGIVPHHPPHKIYGGVAEWVDAADLKSAGHYDRVGSSPTAPTIDVNCNIFPLVRAVLLVRVQREEFL